MTAQNVELLPGVGPQLAAAIRRRFKDDAGFFGAAKSLDLAALQEVEGISPKRAVDLVRHINGGGDTSTYLATNAARKVGEEIMSRLQRFAATDQGRNRLALLAPLATEAAAQRQIAHVMKQKNAVADLDRQAIRRCLRGLRPLREPNAVCDTTTFMIAGSDAAYERLHGLGVGRWCYLGSPRDAGSSGAELTILAHDDEGVDVPADLEVSAGGTLAELAPQALLAWARENRATLKACNDLAAMFAKPTSAELVLDQLDDQSSIQREPKAIRQEIAQIAKLVEANLERELADLALPATELMRAIAAGSLPNAVRTIVAAAIKDGEQILYQQTGIRLQPFKATLPVEVDDDEVDRVLEELQAQSRARAFEAAVRTAKLIAGSKEKLRIEVASWLEYDADFALGCFAHHYDLQAPKFGDQLQFDASVHLALADRSDVQTIAYELGSDQRIAVLTGANSGGKTTLLEHVCQLVLMARLGLPVVGEHVTVPWVDEIHLVTARRGLDAGAFETFLRGFLPIAEGDAKRLVLADEVESVTELESAGRILAFFIDRLNATQSLGVLVTHMAEPILRHVTAAVRIDGIEATGLDENYQLVVDRCPKMGVLARSTPELIVQRLIATTRGPNQALFAALHKCMSDPETRK